MAPGPAAARQACSSDGRCLVSCMACAPLPQMQQRRGHFLQIYWQTYVQMTPGVLYRDSILTWMTIALRAEATSTSLAEVMYRSLRSPFSSWLVASKSKIACAHRDQVQGLHFSRQESLIGVCVTKGTWATCSSNSSGSAPFSLAIFLRAENILPDRAE